jgi:hypothetical protein
MLEYCAALSPWGVFNVNRKADSQFMPPTDFMLRRRARLDSSEAPRPQAGQPAVLVAPTPATGARFAMPGERPPSMYSPGQQDTIIDRLDAWAVASGRVSHVG